MNIEEKRKLIQALTVACEICGTELSATAVKVMIKQLDGLEFMQVHKAIERCMNEITGRLTLQKIKERIDDGRPSPEIAWSQCPKSEKDSAVLTEEQNIAFCSVSAMMASGDIIPARMAFLEKYRLLVTEARAENRPRKHVMNNGYDPQGRIDVVKHAVEDGRLLKNQAMFMLQNQCDNEILALESPTEPAVLLEDNSETIGIEALSHSLRMDR